MNRGLVLALALAAVLAVVLGGPEEMYTTKYDNINVDEILGNDRLYKNYFQCLIGEADTVCTPEGKELRRMIPDAIKTRCEKCNDKQKAVVKKVILTLQKNHADDWEKLRAKWDPTNEYYKKYESLLAE